MAAAGGAVDRPFRSDFTPEGDAELREAMKQKLGDFMGDCTDDSLVEYVMVLLKGGRLKDGAIKDLNVFLGDQSSAFVSWLWDHLSLNSHLYVQRDEKEVFPADISKGLAGRLKFPAVCLTNETPAASGSGATSSNTVRSRPPRERKGLSHEKNEAFPLRNLITGILLPAEKSEQKPSAAKQTLSQLQNGRKRNREAESQAAKKDQSSQPVVGASRLLQFAVRDAVNAAQQKKHVEPCVKRLRSVVSTSSTGISRDNRLHRSSRIRQAPGAALALKAAAEAAEDVTRLRFSGSVFDRLGEGRRTEDNVNQTSHEEHMVGEEFDEDQGLDHFEYREHGEFDKEDPGDLPILEDSEMNVDSVTDDSAVNDNDTLRDGESTMPHVLNPFVSSRSFGDSLPSVIEKKVAICDYADEQYDEDQATSAPVAASKVVNGSVISTSRKPPRKNLGEVQVQENVGPVERASSTEKANVSFTKESGSTDNIKEPKVADPQKDSQSTSRTVSSYAISHPTEDPDSRTLYVNNVHFAATKDTLSRHFNKFGAVLKVIIVTNAATGLPTGSAYVEFLHKESAERALSLNGTSFMNRPLKVVQRSAHEAAQYYGWSGKSSLYPTMHSRVPFPRPVLPGALRGRVPVKAGARSLQWKREPAISQSTSGVKSSMKVPISAEQVPPSIAK